MKKITIKKRFKDSWDLFKLPFINLYNLLRDIYLEIKWFIQRGKRGYSDRDTWSIDYWLSNILPNALRQLKRAEPGIPTCMFKKSDPLNKNKGFTKEAFRRAEKRWNKKLDNMIYTFETVNNILENNWHYTSSKKYYTKENKSSRDRMQKLEFMKIMTLKECKMYEQGWTDFQKYFFSLWD